MAKKSNPKHLRDKVRPTEDRAIREEDRISEGPEICSDDQVVVTGGNGDDMPNFNQTMEDLGIADQIIENLKMMNIQSLRSIQKHVIPLISQPTNQEKPFRDVVAFARTGSGKTMAYLIALINAIVKKNQENPSVSRKPRVVIFVRNQEAALQLHKDALKIAGESDIYIRTASGNVHMQEEIRGLNEGADLVIATTGRFMSYMQEGKIAVDALGTVVLDDADQFLADESWKGILKTLKEYVKRKRFLLFSATCDGDTKYKFVNPKHWRVTAGRLNQVNPLIHQSFIWFDKAYLKCEKVIEILRSKVINGVCPKTLIFVNDMHKADFIGGRLQFYRDPSNPEFRFRCTACHAKVGSVKRDVAMDRFCCAPEREDSFDVLIASDKISSGVSTPAKIVINFDVPYNVHTYILRVGRTGRNGHLGEAFTFLTVNDLKHRENKVNRQLYGILKVANESEHDEFPQQINDFWESGKLRDV